MRQRIVGVQGRLALLIAVASFIPLLHLRITLAESKDFSPESYRKEILKVTSRGLSPDRVLLHHLDGSVFIYNGTERDLITFEIDWGKRSAHCASANLQLTESGVLRTVKPIQPGDFGIACFPKPGDYPVRIYGINSSQTPQRATIQVTGGG